MFRKLCLLFLVSCATATALKDILVPGEVDMSNRNICEFLTRLYTDVRPLSREVSAITCVDRQDVGICTLMNNFFVEKSRVHITDTKELLGCDADQMLNAAERSLACDAMRTLPAAATRLIGDMAKSQRSENAAVLPRQLASVLRKFVHNHDVLSCGLPTD